MESLYICDLKGESLDCIYTFPQLLPGLVTEALGRYVLCGVDNMQWPFIFILNLGSSTGEVQALQRVSLVAFGAMYEPLASCVIYMCSTKGQVVA